jgi:hypothetical protein
MNQIAEDPYLVGGLFRDVFRAFSVLPDVRRDIDWCAQNINLIGGLDEIIKAYRR